MEYYPAIKSEEMMPSVTWMDPDSIMPVSEVSQREKDKGHRTPLICGI